MSADPLLDKMDALLKKHRVVAAPAAPAVAQTAPPEMPVMVPPPMPEGAWLPVLTDVVAESEWIAPPVVETAAQLAAVTPVQDAATAVQPIDPEAILNALEPRIGAFLQAAVVTEIQQGMDSALAHLLVQMDVHVREIVREVINEKLGKSFGK